MDRIAWMGVFLDVVCVLYLCLVWWRYVFYNAMPLRVRSRYVRRAGAVTLTVLVGFTVGLVCTLAESLGGKCSRDLKGLVQVATNSFCLVLWAMLRLLQLGDIKHLECREVAFAAESHVSDIEAQRDLPPQDRNDEGERNCGEAETHSLEEDVVSIC